jgi:hypothetical protein
MGSRLLENARELLFRRRIGDAAPPRGCLAAMAMQNLGGEPRFRGGQAETAAQIYFSPPPVAIGVVHRDNGDGRPHADLRNMRELDFGSKRCHRHLKGRSAEIARDREFAAGAAKRGRGSRA